MTGWEWWAGDIDDDDYCLEGGCSSKAEVVRNVSRYMKPGDQFRIIEARSSTDRRYEGSDMVPFLRTRNKEVITVGPASVERTDA
jgi:hypothetical protein